MQHMRDESNRVSSIPISVNCSLGEAVSRLLGKLSAGLPLLVRPESPMKVRRMKHHSVCPS